MVARASIQRETKRFSHEFRPALHQIRKDDIFFSAVLLHHMHEYTYIVVYASVNLCVCMRDSVRYSLRVSVVRKNKKDSCQSELQRMPVTKVQCIRTEENDIQLYL